MNKLRPGLLRSLGLFAMLGGSILLGSNASYAQASGTATNWTNQSANKQQSSGGSLISWSNINGGSSPSVGINDGQTSQYILLSGFFSSASTLPNNAIITGIQVTINKTRSENNVADRYVGLNFSPATGGDFTPKVNSNSSTSWASSFGSSSDKWGFSGTLNGSTLKNSNFGIVYACRKTDGAGQARTVTITGASITLTYTLPGSVEVHTFTASVVNPEYGTAGPIGTLKASAANLTNGTVVEFTTNNPNFTVVPPSITASSGSFADEEIVVYSTATAGATSYSNITVTATAGTFTDDYTGIAATVAPRPVEIAVNNFSRCASAPFTNPVTGTAISNYFTISNALASEPIESVLITADPSVGLDVGANPGVYSVVASAATGASINPDNYVFTYPTNTNGLTVNSVVSGTITGAANSSICAGSGASINLTLSGQAPFNGALKITDQSTSTSVVYPFTAPVGSHSVGIDPVHLTNTGTVTKTYLIEWQSLAGSGSTECNAGEAYKSGSVEIHVLPVPSATLLVNNAATANVCNAGTLTLDAVNTHAGGTYNISAVYNNVAVGSNVPTTSLANQVYGPITQTYNLIDPTQNGTVVYTLIPQRVDGQAACIGTAQVLTVTVNAEPTFALTFPADICEGATVGNIIDLDGSTTHVGSVEVLLDNSVVATSLPYTISTGTPNEYNYSVKATNGACSVTLPAVVSVNPLPNFDFAIPTILCEGSNITVGIENTSNVDAYEITANGNTEVDAPFVIVDADATTYNFSATATSDKLCQTTKTTSITVNSRPSFEIDVLENHCEGEDVVIALSNSVNVNSYTISIDGVEVSEDVPFTATDLTVDAHTITVSATSTDGCDTVITKVINVRANPSFDIVAPTAVCENAPFTVAIDNGENLDTYTITYGTDTETDQAFEITNASGSSYTFEVTGSNQYCSTTDEATVSVNAIPSFTIDAPLAECEGGTIIVSITGQLTSDDYTISSGSQSANNQPLTIANISGTSYEFEVEVTNENCSTTKTATVTVNPNPVFTAIGDEICAGETATVDVDPNFSNIDTWELLDANDNVVATSFPASLSGLPAGTHTYTVKGISDEACVTTTTVSVVVNANPSFTIVAPDVCAGQPALISLDNIAATGDYTITSGSLISTNGPLTVPTTAAGTVNFTVTASNSNTCSTTISSSLTVKVVPSFDVVADNVCAGQSIVVSLANQTNLNNYEITDGTNTTTNGPLTVATTTDGSVEFTVTATNSLGCTTTETKTVTVNPLPSFTIVAPNVCAGQPIEASIANVQNVMNYTINDGINTATNSSLTSATSGAGTRTITVTATSEFGCQTISSQVVTINELPTLAVMVNANIIANGGTTPTCENAPATIAVNATDAVSTWATFNNGTSIVDFFGSAATPIALNSGEYSHAFTPTNVSAGAYTVYVKDNNGCVNSSIANVTIQAAPAITSVSVANVCEGSAANVTVQTNVASYETVRVYYTVHNSTNPADNVSSFADVYSYSGTLYFSTGVSINNSYSHLSIDKITKWSGLGCEATFTDKTANFNIMNAPTLNVAVGNHDDEATDAGNCTKVFNYTISANANGSPITNYYIEYSGATSASFYSADPNQTITLNKGITTVNVWASNTCGWTSIETFTVNVKDKENPSLALNLPVGGVTLNVGNGNNCQVTMPDYTGYVTATDNCAVTSLTQLAPNNPGSTVIGYGGDRKIVFKAVDAAGNEDTISFYVNLIDNTPPTALAQDVIVYLDENGEASVSALQVNNGSTDKCTAPANLVMSLSDSTFTCDDKGANLVTLSVKDQANNVSTAMAYVIVVDDIAPTIAPTSNFTEKRFAKGALDACTNELGDFTYLVGSEIEVVENCVNYTIHQSPAATTIVGASASSVMVTLTVTDESTLSNSYSFLVYFDDSTAPVFTVAPASPIVVNAPAGACEAFVSWGTVAGTDNCDDLAAPTITLQTSQANNTVFTVGTHPVTYRITDAAGNYTDTTFIVEVKDVTAPVIPQMNPIAVTTGSQCNAVVSWTAPIPTDACGPDMSTMEYTVSQDGNTVPLQNGGAWPVGTYTVTYTVADFRGNVSDPMSFAVEVEDVTIPVIDANTVQDLTVDATVACEALVDWTYPVADDNCAVDQDTWVYEVRDANDDVVALAKNDIWPVGVYTVIVKVSDVNNLESDPASFTISVVDAEAPVIATVNDVIVGTSGDCEAAVNWIEPVATDNCGVDYATYGYTVTHGGAPVTHENGENWPVGVYTVTYNVADNAGNNASPMSFTVTVNDLTAPEFDLASVPANMTVNVPSGCAATVNWTAPVAEDNCANSTVSYTYSVHNGVEVVALENGQTWPVGTYTVTYIATDNSNNPSTPVSFTVQVKDMIAPVVTASASQSTYIVNSANCEYFGVTLNVGVEDNCTPTNDISVQYVIGNTVVPNIATYAFSTGTTIVQVQATDASGNIGIATVPVTVVSPIAATAEGSATVMINSLTTATVRFAATGGTAPYTFTYTKSNGSSVVTNSVQTLSTDTAYAIAQDNTIAGTYTYELISVTDANGYCVGNIDPTKKVVVITVTPQPAIDLKPVIVMNANTFSASTVLNRGFTVRIENHGTLPSSGNYGLWIEAPVTDATLSLDGPAAAGWSLIPAVNPFTQKIDGYTLLRTIDSDPSRNIPANGNASVALRVILPNYVAVGTPPLKVEIPSDNNGGDEVPSNNSASRSLIVLP
jgi:hypothetical protein